MCKNGVKIGQEPFSALNPTAHPQTGWAVKNCGIIR